MKKMIDIRFDENQPVPKYRRIIDAIADRIKKGELKKGDRIPSLNMLCRQYKLSRDTVMMAYKEDLYDAFKTTLQGQGTEQIFFHHNNLMLFKTILESANGEFSEYVIMPGKIGRDHGRQITE